MSELPAPDAILSAAIKLSPEDRQAFLEKACGGNIDLQTEIERMIAAQPHLGEFLEKPLPKAEPDLHRTRPYESPAEASGTVIGGKYKLLQQIGEGGMGSVWMADQTNPVKRRVAVKLIRTDRGQSKTILSRFEAERQAIALMDHPHIARLLDAGTTDNGSPFFVMELVKGTPLNTYCDERQLSIAERLNLFMQICSAVQHAHQKGVIHRDLKPSNILVESHDHTAVPKVIDFGLAKAVSGLQLTEQTLFTALGTVAGTPLYMAPEQAAFNAVDVDTRADIYALGVILYELLTGTTPIEREQFKKAAFDEILRVIRENEPPTPSKRLSSSESKPSSAANRQMEPMKLSRFLRGDLDWIVMKALSKERDRRYETANGFAKDLERFLNHEPVQAGPPSVGYKVRKFVRRNRPQVVAGSLVLLALVGGITGTTLGMVRAENKRQDAEYAQEKEAEQRTNAENKEREANDERIKALLAAEEAQKARKGEAEQRVRAEKAWVRTREALDAMTSSVTGDSLTTQKSLSEEQKKFLSEVLTYYRDFAGENADSLEARIRAAMAADRVGLIEFRLGHMKEAAAAYRMAYEGYDKLAKEQTATPVLRHAQAISYSSCGLMLVGLSKRQEAEKQYVKAIGILEQLTLQFPDSREYRKHLGSCYDFLGVLLAELGCQKEAETQDLNALTIQQKLVNDFPGEWVYQNDLAKSHSHFADLLAKQGKRDEALEHYLKAVSIHEKLTEVFPRVQDYRFSLCTAMNNLASLHAEWGQSQKAIDYFTRLLPLIEKLFSESPTEAKFGRELANTNYNLGMLSAKLGMQSKAEGYLTQSLSIHEKMAETFPTVPEHRLGMSRSLNMLGSLRLNQGKRAEAAVNFREALSIQEKLSLELSDVPQIHVELGGHYCNFGGFLSNGGQLEEALIWFAKAIKTLQTLHERNPQLVIARVFLRNSHWGRAIAHERLERYSDAVKDWDKAIELSTEQERPPLRAQRLNPLIKTGQILEAIADVSALAKLDRWDSNQWYNFACICSIASEKSTDKKVEYANRAMELLNKAVKAGYSDSKHIRIDLDLDPLRTREDFKKLLDELEMKAKKQ
jgi:serine/threonine protein kinase/tetratricopeptide (TPR) repeat protein